MLKTVAPAPILLCARSAVYIRPRYTTLATKITKPQTNSRSLSQKSNMGSHPDAELHPVATGPAAQIVSARSAEKPLKLYSGWFCPFVQRTWIVLEEKNLDYQYIEVNPYNKPKSLLDLNPRGLVPTLAYHDKPGLYESSVLCEFLEDAYPDSKKLRPQDPYDAAKGRIWGDFVGSRIVNSYHRFLQFQGEGDALREKQAEFLGYLKDFTKAMDPTGPFFFGADFSMVDIMMAPWATRLWVFEHFKGGSGIPEEGKGGEDEEVWRRWRVWLKAVQERKSVKETCSEREHYLPIYQRYAEDRAMSEAAKAIRAGRAMP